MHAWLDSSQNPWLGAENAQPWNGDLPRMGQVVFFSAKPRGLAEKWGALSCDADASGEPYYTFGPAGCGLEAFREVSEEEAFLIVEALRSVME